MERFPSTLYWKSNLKFTGCTSVNAPLILKISFISDAYKIYRINKSLNSFIHEYTVKVFLLENIKELFILFFIFKSRR